MDFFDFNLPSNIRSGFLSKNERMNFENPLVISDFQVINQRGVTLLINYQDELPFLFYSEEIPLIGAALLTKEKSLKEELLLEMKGLIATYALKPEKLQCFLGPSLTFSHTPVEREILEWCMKNDYRMAAKRTSGVDFLDVPFLNALQLRKLKIPFANIHLTPYDTFECEDLFYSALRGEKEKNVAYISLN